MSNYDSVYIIDPDFDEDEPDLAEIARHEHDEISRTVVRLIEEVAP